MTIENEKSSQVVVDPADMTGAELYDHLSKQFYPFVLFCQMAGFVNSGVTSLAKDTENALSAAIRALEVANQYPESNLQMDLTQNYQKLLVLQEYLGGFEPLPEAPVR